MVMLSPPNGIVAAAVASPALTFPHTWDNNVKRSTVHMLISSMNNHRMGSKFCIRRSLIYLLELSGQISDCGVNIGGKPANQCNVEPPMRLAATPDRAVVFNKCEASRRAKEEAIALRSVDFPVPPAPLINTNC